jgi:peptide chain release factor subunit 1
MITYSQVEKLLSARTAEPAVLSLYLQVPMDPPALRGLPARAGELVALAGGSADDPGAPRVRDEDRQLAQRLMEIHGRDWLGHTVAIFACGQLGLAEAIPLPCRLPDRAVLATRPHVRPLLVALQRCPAYHVVLVDRRHAWVFGVAGKRIDTIAQAAAEGVRSPGFGGCYGLDSHRVNERIIQLARRHYLDTAAILEHTMPGSGQAPLVVGGHEETIPQLLAALPASVRDRYAGSFVADPRTMTPARVRALADPVIEHWVNAREQRLVEQILHERPGGLTAIGVNACLAAVNQHAARLLLVPVGGLIPGFACQRCGALSSTGTECPDGVTASRRVSDLIEEMAVTAISDGGQVVAVSDPPADIAARLRFPLSQGDGR